MVLARCRRKACLISFARRSSARRAWRSSREIHGPSLIRAEHCAQAIQFLTERRTEARDPSDPLAGDGCAGGRQTPQQALHARQVDAGLVDEVLDDPQPRELVVRVDAHAADGAARPHEAQAFVLAERLRVHPEVARGHTDEEQLLLRHRRIAAGLVAAH